ncbi:MAG: hypothetical protein Pg6C_09630 [Treponemataceae bacterium]|nr:MAG: hypothetical protein Pg6C_09630 [Treponemataceae bacterium]
MLGHSEIIIIVIVALVLFGASAIPKFARSLGQAKKEFTTAMKESEKEEETNKESNAGKQE